jgi:hypothetical protein
MKKQVGRKKRRTRWKVEEIWTDYDRHYVMRFKPISAERIVYLQLLRMTRMQGMKTVFLTESELSAAVTISRRTVGIALRLLMRRGALRRVSLTHWGQKLFVVLPHEIPKRAMTPERMALAELKTLNCFTRGPWRMAIYRREKFRCFYCQRHLPETERTIDHVIPRNQGGGDTFDNVVACCRLCNMAKRLKSAKFYLRELRRQRVLSQSQYRSRLAALRALQAGKLRPVLPAAA